LGTPGAGRAETAADCRVITDDARRLNCYDTVFGGVAPPPADPTLMPMPQRQGGAAPPGSAVEQASKEAADAVASRPSPQVQAAGVATPAAPEPQTALSTLDTAWELSPQTRRSGFIVRTYEPNYLLPLHSTTSLNRSPSSPTHGSTATPAGYKPTEAKFQISLRTKVAEGLLLSGDALWFAYTQRSLWQVWNRRDSAPFRSTDYQPEAIYVVPVPDRIGKLLPWGWRWQMAQVGFAHQSNGQSDPLSRSWNRVYVGAGLTKGEMSLQWRLNHRLHEKASDDDNPDLTDYLGTNELRLAWLPGKATAALNWRLNVHDMSRGSWQFDYSYPVDGQQPQGLRWYLQLFSGFGETLLDYNHRQTSIGLGFAVFQL
jgi:phospholipase A1